MRARVLILLAAPIIESFGQSLPPAAARALDSSGVAWARKETAHTTVYVAKGSAAASHLTAIAGNAERAVAANVNWLGVKSAGPRLRLFFVGSREEMRPFTGGTPGGWSVIDEGTAFFVANDSIHPAVKHETMHLLATRLWGKPAGTWLQEGLATAAVGTCMGQTVEQVAAAARTAGMFVPLDTLRRAFNFGGEVGVVHYYEAASLVRYIDRTYGRKKLRAIWTSGLDDSERILGVAPDSLEAKWRATLSNVAPKMSWPKWWARVKARGCE